MSWTACIAILMSFCLCSESIAGAGVETPHLLPLQGYATDAQGTPLPRADLAVRVFEVASGGVPIYDSAEEFTGAVHSGFVDLMLGTGIALLLDNTRLYHMEIFLDGVEMVGPDVGGRWAFYPGTGSHERSDLEARLDVLEAAVGVPKSASLGGAASTDVSAGHGSHLAIAPMEFRAIGSTARLEYGSLGVGSVEGATGAAQVSALMLLQPVGIFATGDRVLKLGPKQAPLPDQITGVDEPSLPVQTALLGCYPNPFNPRTVIVFDLAREARVELAVYDLAGRKVRRLRAESLSAGRHSVPWDGRDEGGNFVSSGVYLYRLSTQNYEQAKRMVLLK